MTPRKNLEGMRFGRLVAMKIVDIPSHIKHKGVTYWLCKCDCGNEKVVWSSSLVRGDTVSCGCLKSERARKEFGKACFLDVLKGYKGRARRNNIPFELSEDEFAIITKQNCYYCGKHPSQINKSGFNNGDYVYNGIDRLDSNKGYTLENSVPCCIRCNRAKSNYSEKEFYEWINIVKEHRKI